MTIYHENGKAYAVEVEFMKLKVGSGTLLESVPDKLPYHFHR